MVLLPPSTLSPRLPRLTELSTQLTTPLTKTYLSFWLFGLINNVLYVLILSSALDLVPPTTPKSTVLLADILPSLLAKLLLPHLLSTHPIPYPLRILTLASLSTSGMLILTFTSSVGGRMAGVALASLSSGAGEVTFLGLTHYYGRGSLGGWGGGTGGAGLVGAGLWVLLREVLGWSVSFSLGFASFLPLIMLGAFFFVLPREPLRSSRRGNGYTRISSTTVTITHDEEEEEGEEGEEGEEDIEPAIQPRTTTQPLLALKKTMNQTLPLLTPYMLPLTLVYFSEYTINTSLLPQNLLFPLPTTPFTTYPSFYPTYTLLYQTFVFLSRSSLPFYRLPHLLPPSLLQALNLLLLLSHALYPWLPSVYWVFAVVAWEGVLGGSVYVGTYAKVMEEVWEAEREFALGAVSVADSIGICAAGFLGLWLEPWVCGRQVEGGRGLCRMV